MKLALKKGSTSVSLYIFIQDSSSTTGAGKTGLAYNSASLTAYYVRPAGTPTAITLATLANAQAAYSSGGFVEVDATNMPGLYRLDLPNAAIASGVNSVVVMLKGASGMAPLVLEIMLVAYDPQDAAALGLTNIDAAISTRSTYAGADTSGTTTLLSRIGGAITITSGKVDVNDKTGFSLSSAGVQAIWDALTSALTTVGSIGKLLVTNVDATVSSRLASASYTAPANSTITTISAYVSAIKDRTDNLPNSPVDSSQVPSPADIRAEIDSNSTKLDAAISTRVEWPRKLRQPAKAQISLNGAEGHERVSKEVHQRVQE